MRTTDTLCLQRILKHVMQDRGLLKYVGTAARIILCCGLLFFLFKQMEMKSLYGVLLKASSHWMWLGCGIVMTFLGLAAGALRWKRILESQGIPIPGRRVIQIFLAGQFFNAFMLGACGGDVVRAYYATQGRKGKRTEATITIVMDRAIGLFSMILFCCLMIFVRIHVFLDNEGPRDTGFLMLIFLAVSVIGIFIAFRHNLFERFQFFRRLENKTKIGPLLRRIYEAMYIYRHHHRLILVAVIFSLFSMAFLTLACWSFGQALELAVPVVDYFALFPVISVLMAVPLTPGSLGVRENLFVSLFSAIMVDKPHALLLSLLVYGGGLFWSLAGGIVYLAMGAAGEDKLPEMPDPWQEDPQVPVTAGNNPE